MRNFTFKGAFLAMLFMLFGCLSLYAADDDLITKQITIKLEAPGTLPDSIGSSKKYKITNLKIVGEINGKDWRMIRDMAGGTYDITGNTLEHSSGKLSKLDLSEAIMVEDHENAYANFFVWKDLYVTNRETIPDYIFSKCSSLQEINFPSYIKSIGEGAFYRSGLTSVNIPFSVTEIVKGAFTDCRSLTSISIPSSVTEIGTWAF